MFQSSYIKLKNLKILLVRALEHAAKPELQRLLKTRTYWHTLYQLQSVYAIFLAPFLKVFFSRTKSRLNQGSSQERVERLERGGVIITTVS